MYKSLLAFFALFILVSSTACAQDGADPWQEKKAKAFKPLTEDQQASITAAIPDKATAEPKQARRILMFYRCEGFIHTSIPWANFAVQEMGRKADAVTVALADTYDVF